MKKSSTLLGHLDFKIVVGLHKTFKEDFKVTIEPFAKECIIFLLSREYMFLGELRNTLDKESVTFNLEPSRQMLSL